MRRLTILMLAAILLFMSCPVANAQGKFKLTWKDPDTDGLSFLAVIGRKYLTAGEKPADLKGVPAGLGKDARWFRIPMGKREIVAVREGGRTGRLYLDCDGDGDLSDEKPIELRRSSGEKVSPAAGIARYEASVAGAGGKGETRLSLSPSGEDGMTVALRAALFGEVKLDGKLYKIVLADADLDGRYDSTVSMKEDAASTFGVPYDAFALDRDGDGKFGSGVESMEIVPLTKKICVDGSCYSIEVDVDGRTVEMLKLDTPTGTLKVGPAGSTLMTWSDCGVMYLDAGDGQRIPVGRYWVIMNRITKIDDGGRRWTLSGTSGSEPREFEVKAGETLTFEMGPPLKIKTDVVVQDGEAYMNVSLLGRGGESYSPGAVSGEASPAAPSFKILDAAGKQLAAGKFEYG